MYTLEQLRGFIAVAEEKHFGRAAERLKMTQPPLSRQIQKLELHIGVQLFERNNRQVKLTPAGAAFLKEASRILALAENAPEIARRVATGLQGKITIGFTATSALTKLSAILTELNTHLPDVRVSIQELVSRAQVEGLLHGKLDLGLLRERPIQPELSYQLIHTERLIAAFPSTHPLAAQNQPMDPNTLENQDVIMYDSKDARYFDSLVTKILASVHPRSAQRVGQIHTMLALVSAGRGVAFVPESAQRFKISGVTYRPIKGWQDSIVELFLVWQPSNNNPALARAVNLLS